MSEELSYEEQVNYLALWAVRYSCEFRIEGEVGFGRLCVGMVRGGQYLDYSHVYEKYPDLSYNDFWTPENAYHKHDCMAVLGRGPLAVHQLYLWAKWLEDNGWTTDDVLYAPKDVIDMMIHGTSTPRLVKKND